jgi:hypothetical protein
MGGDLSAARTSPAIYIGKAGSYGVDVAWPATPGGGTNAAGVFAIQENASESAARWETIAFCSTDAYLASRPSGNGVLGGFCVKNIKTTSPYVRVIYTPTSGGAGVIPVVYVS